MFITNKAGKATKKAIIITGATCSGKSDFALKLAKERNGVIINADAMQIYKQTPILSAQPSDTDMQNISHFLYGFVDIFDKTSYSVGKYLQDLSKKVDEIQQNQPEKTPIIVGGTMLYIDAIINGISEIPEIDEKVKNEIREQFANKTAEELFSHLQKIDEKYAKIVDKYNPQRILRGIEVKTATGKSITDFWQEEKKNRILCEYEFEKLIVELPRDVLYEKINKRFDLMIKNGAINEAKEIFDLCVRNNVDCRKLPKVIGLHELFDYFEGKISLETAVERSKQASRNYAKRQLTWFRQRFFEFEKV